MSASLLAVARAQGSVDVIVTLSVAYRPEPELTATEREQQRRAIAAAQDRLIAALSGRAFRIAARYRSLPQIALQVDEQGLRIIAASSDVRSIDRNETSAPAGTAD